MDRFEVPLILETLILVADFVIKVLAIGIVPENRRPSSSSAWLLLILFLPLVGLPLFLLLGSSRVNSRRHRIQAQANDLIDDGLAHLPTVPPGLDLPPGIASIMTLNRQLTSLPCVTGTVHEVLTDYRAMLADIAATIDAATTYVHVQSYIARWDEVSDPVFAAMARAHARGVEVRLLIDHLGSRRYRGYRATKRRLDRAGITWHLMLPIDPLRRRWRRLDLRNHRKVVIVDGRVGYVGSLNLIAPNYDKRGRRPPHREWLEAMVRVGGPIVGPLESVFAVDWYTESGEVLDAQTYVARIIDQAHPPIGGPDTAVNALQVVPSGPGFETQPNLRLFTSLIHRAQHRLLIVSPYFVPDESILEAVTTAAHRGVQVELFVSEQADQFVVQHAQASYYTVLLECGVRIHRYPTPYVLHAKFVVVDDDAAVIGSSNMDMRSFGLNYEISLMGAAGDLPRRLSRVADDYRDASSELSLGEWEQRPLPRRYLENVLRLTSALQ